MEQTTNNFGNKLLFRMLVYSSIIPLFFLSCKPVNENPQLLMADSLMTEYPDTALAILESIPSTEKFSRADNAFYALLLTQARHKNYVTLNDDSLIKIAVDYYGDKKSLRASQAHYYNGITYKDMGHVSFAVEEYLKAILLMPEKNELLAVMYNTLAGCYENDNLFNEALGAYRAAYIIFKDDKYRIFYPLRGMAHVFLLQNQLDSALCYYQKALDNAILIKDSIHIGALYHDFAMVYEQRKDHVIANEYVTKALAMMDSMESANACYLKGQIMMNLDEPDSARYYFNKNNNGLDIYGQSLHYGELYNLEKKLGNWKAAIENADKYLILYDSIQGLSDSHELARLMDNYQLEKYKRKLSERSMFIIGSLVALFIILMVMGLFWVLWSDRKRKKDFIFWQEQISQKRVDDILNKEETNGSDEPDTKQLMETLEQVLTCSISMYKTTDIYKRLQELEKMPLKELVLMKDSMAEINNKIRTMFVDVIDGLKKLCPGLTTDDLFYCVLSLIHSNRFVIMQLMNATTDALKTRKSRIKNKMAPDLFKFVFRDDNQ